MNPTTIYVALLNEDTKVWRPVSAILIEPDRYKILSKMPADEVWEFVSGETVVCKESKLSDAMQLIAYKKAD